MKSFALIEFMVVSILMALSLVSPLAAQENVSAPANITPDDIMMPDNMTASGNITMPDNMTAPLNTASGNLAMSDNVTVPGNMTPGNMKVLVHMPMKRSKEVTQVSMNVYLLQNVTLNIITMQNTTLTRDTPQA